MSDDTEISDAELRSLAERLAREAGKIAIDGRRSVGDRFRGDTKSSRTDVVTEFDRAAEAHIVGELRRLRPTDAIIGEEGTDDAGTSGIAWFLDPIDGTTNFVYDHAAWACSIGVARGDEMVAGAVFVPPTGEMFSAATGAGATLDGRPISTSGETELALALVGTGFTYNADRRQAQGRVVAELIGEVRDIRRLGSAAVDLCMVACGRLDVYYERYLNSWDAAAGELIAREAGAVTSDFAGQKARPDEMIAAAPAVHAAFLAALAGASDRSPGNS
jgi:myo-inositol-1(or 4)-monophosphatase